MSAIVDHEQFAKLFAQQQSRVYAFVRTMLPNASDAEEVFQQTVLVLWRKWAQFDPQGAFLHWANGIAYNEARNYLRRHERRNLRLGDRALDLVAEATDEMDDWLENRRVALAACVERLPDRDRGILNRCYAEGVSIRDVAGEFGMTANVMYKSLRKIRRALFNCVNRTLLQGGPS